jgi:hypothetical protein
LPPVPRRPGTSLERFDAPFAFPRVELVELASFEGTT